MGLLKSFFSQTRKPEGVLGKLMVNGMNGSGHAKLADWGMAHLGGIAPSNIAELGCGGGRNAAELLRRYPRAKLTALDYPLRHGPEHHLPRIPFAEMDGPGGGVLCLRRAAPLLHRLSHRHAVCLKNCL